MIRSGSNAKGHSEEKNVKWEVWYFKCRRFAEKFTVSLSTGYNRNCNCTVLPTQGTHFRAAPVSFSRKSSPLCFPFSGLLAGWFRARNLESLSFYLLSFKTVTSHQVSLDREVICIQRLYGGCGGIHLYGHHSIGSHRRISSSKPGLTTWQDLVL